MDYTVFGFKNKALLSKDNKISETINLEDKCQLHSKPKDYLASKEFLSIHRILHLELTGLSTRIHTDDLSWDYVISPTEQDCTVSEQLQNDNCVVPGILNFLAQVCSRTATKRQKGTSC